MKKHLNFIVILALSICLAGCSQDKAVETSSTNLGNSVITENVEESAEEIAEGTSKWVTEEINVEKRDITHDGVVDYIVTSMQYDSADVNVNSTQKERIAQQIMYNVVEVKVYEGKENSATYSEDDFLWGNEYSRVHAGNGQLSIVQIDGNDYLLTSSFYGGQGFATWNYEVFSLKQNGEISVFDKQSIEFEMGAADSSECYKEYQLSLNKYTNNGILIVACDIDFEEQLIRTQENLYILPDYYDKAFTKFD